MNTVVCPNCGKDVEISLALTKQIEQDVILRQKERFAKELETVKKEALEKSAKKLQEQFSLQLKNAQEDAKEKDERINDLIEQITELTKSVRQSKRERDEAKLEMEKKLSEEEEKIRADAAKKAEEAQALKLAEKEKQLQDALKANEDLHRKLTQGSQQLQGEAFELAFETILQKEFSNDKIVPVGKGVKGGDIIQEVWDRNGNYCGKILWELKNTKAWNEQWINKLKIDQRAITAEYAVIISEVVPQGIDSAKFYKQIWVTKQNFMIALACSLRLNLIQVTMAKRAAEGKKEKMEILYSYLSGTEFKHRVEAIVDAFSNMQQEIEKEKRYFTNKWARDEKNIRQVIDNTYGMHGDLKGIIGSGLAQIKGLESEPSLPDGQKADIS
ncbi:MAG: DUF2130 domain-containing protein [Candidatus Levybacteria bacterium]|nr:DUF2130 domain-containing protein [Candidatus Levybacteria bacterium]